MQYNILESKIKKLRLMEIWGKGYVYLEKSVQQRSLCYKYLEFNSSALINLLRK